mgnify:CR=1 FL=1
MLKVCFETTEPLCHLNQDTCKIQPKKNSAEVNIKEMSGGISIPRLTFEEWSNATAPVLNARCFNRVGLQQIIYRNSKEHATSAVKSVSLYTENTLSAAIFKEQRPCTT